MKVTLIYSKKTKKIVFWTLNKFEALEYYESENLDSKYYDIIDINSQAVEDYYVGNVSRKTFDVWIKKELRKRVC